MNARDPRAGLSRMWIGYLAAGALVTIVYYLLPAKGAGLAAQIVLYCAVSVSAAIMVGYGILRHRPHPTLPWAILGVSQVSYAVADISFSLAHYVFGVADYPGVADLFYLAHYPLLAAGLMTLIRRRGARLDLPRLLDSGVIGVGAGMLSWVYLIAPNARLGTPVLAKITSLAYPLAGLLVLVVALRLILGDGRRPLSFYLLVGHVLTLITADTVYVLQQLAGTYQSNNFLDAIWLASSLALGAAAMHPTMSRLAGPAPPRDTNTSPGRIAVLCGTALIVPITLVVQNSTGGLRDAAVIAIACVLLFGLTIARLASLASSQRRLAITDSLTGLYTRRFFEIQLPIEVARARRTGGSLGVFVIDVDHFKSVNDRYGHPAGDQALCEIAARLGSATRRDVDLLARHGGEEFALLVPDAGVGELAGIAERLRDRVADGPIEVSEGTLITVTVSVGATCFPAHGDSPNELVSNADRALYAAKARGRDRVIVGQVMTVDADEAFPDGTATVDYLGLVADRVDMLLGATGRSRAVGRWSAILATAMGLSEATVRTAELAGRLHSIGKIVIPESVLTKPMPWSEDERRLVRTHPELGYRLARAVPGFAAVADAIRQQHEHYDGGGHPSRLAGAGIRVEARILSVCEYWADLLLDRPHQPALSALAAAERLRAERATRFDPVVVDLFLDLQRAGRVGERCPLAERTVPRRTPRGPRTAREPA